MRAGHLAWAVLAWTVAAAASGQEYYGYKILHDPFPYYVDSRNGSPAGLSLQAVETATQAAFQAWEDVACTYVDFTYMGLTGSTVANPPDPADDFSVAAVWVLSSTDPYYDTALGGGTAPAASIPLVSAGRVLRCDIYLNAVNFNWSVQDTPPSNQMHLKSALMHEIGHCLGLADEVEPGHVMHWQLLPGEKRDLPTSKDEQHLCGAYQKNGYGAPCTQNGDGTHTCQQVGRALDCITSPMPDGSTSTPYCSEGCNYNTNLNSCEAPLTCQENTVLFPGFTGACLIHTDNVVRVGQSCGDAGQCGPSSAECLPQDVLPSGAPLWANGYCTKTCSPGDATTCPVGSACVDLGSPLGPKCLQTCPPESSACRPGYSCALLEGMTDGVCISSCAGDVDCPNGSGGFELCRACDGLCFQKENPRAQLGDRCTADTECGPMQFCYRFSYSSFGICTQTCTTECSGCPEGSFCGSVGAQNDQLCLRTCQENTCAPLLQCGAVTEGRGCMPPCATDLNCPSGWRCTAGQCYDPAAVADAGASCALCFSGEGGAGSPILPPDGGSGGIISGGCGCQGAGTAALAWAAVLFVAAAARRRRALPRG